MKVCLHERAPHHKQVVRYNPSKDNWVLCHSKHSRISCCVNSVRFVVCERRVSLLAFFSGMYRYALWAVQEMKEEKKSTLHKNCD